MPSRFQKRMSVRHQVESGAPFNANRDLRVDIVIERGGLRDASASGFRHKSILIDVTYADPLAGFTCVPEVLTKMDQLLQLLTRESVTTTPALGTRPSTSAAINLSPLQLSLIHI